MAGAQAIDEIPERCFDIKQFYTESQERGRDYRRMGVRNAAVIDDADTFDAAFFGMSKREARVMDPQQRKLLEVAHEAVEASGYCNTSHLVSNAPETFGVYVAAATDDYIANLECQEVDVFYSPATLRAFMAGRISHHFGWSGPSIVVDTACSSSLVALHMACRAIQTGDCRAALVAGVNIISSPLTMLGLWRGHFLSPDGKCKTYDASADGYGRAEGVAAFVVKKLQDAVHDQDCIEAVICGTALNQSGLAVSITHPHVETQHALFKKLHQDTRISPDQVGYVEMHGTGTKAGDRCEMASVTSLYGSTSNQPAASGVTAGRRVPLMVGSVKANVGHAEAAAGFAGLCKLLGMLKHFQIPPQVSLKTLNPELRALVETHKVQIPTSATEWPRPPNGAPRVALLNSFGAAGSNASAILMEHVTVPPSSSTLRARENAHADSLFCLSARTSHGMHKLICDYLVWIRASRNACNDELGSRLCYSTCARRIHHPHYRLAFSVPGANLDMIEGKLASALDRFDAGEKLERIGKASAPVVGLLSTHLDISSFARQRLWSDKLFKRFWDETVQALPTSQTQYISDLLCSSSRREKKALSLVRNIATLKTWSAWSVDNLRIAAPTHESQLAWKVYTGAIPLQDALEQSMNIEASVSDLALAPLYKLKTAEIDTDLQISRPKSIVILTDNKAGLIAKLDTQEALDQAFDQLESMSMWEILAALYTYGAQIDFEQLLAIAGQQVSPLSDLPLHSFAKDRYWVSYQAKVAQAALQKQQIQTNGASAETLVAAAASAHGQASPSTETAKKRYQVEACQIHSVREQGVSAYVLPVREVKDEILGHKVAGVGMCPASVYHEMMLASAEKHLNACSETAHPNPNILELADVQYSAPLRYDEANPGSIICQLKRITELENDRGIVYSVTILSSCLSCSGKNQVTSHASASLAVKPMGADSTIDVARIVTPSPPVLSTAQKDLYATFADRVVDYSDLYQTIASLRTTKDATNGEATLTDQAKERIHKQMWSGEYVLSPILQDTLLHACGYMAHTSPQYQSNVVFIAQSVGKVRYLDITSKHDSVQQIAVELQWDARTSSFLASAQALSLNGRVIVSVDKIRFKKLSKRSFFSVLNGSTCISAAHVAPMPAEAVCRSAAERNSSNTNTSDTIASPHAKKVSGRPTNMLPKIISTIALATGINENSIDPKSTLEELGVDSLLFIELISYLNKSVGKQFAARFEEIGIDSGLTIADLAQLASSDDGLGAKDRDTDVVQSASPTPLVEAFDSSSAAAMEYPGIPQKEVVTQNSKAAEVQAAEVLARILGTSTAELADQHGATLEELGLDSLGILELVQALRTEFGTAQLDVDLISNDVTFQEYLSAVCPPKPEKAAQESIRDADISVKATAHAQTSTLRPVVEGGKKAITLDQNHKPTVPISTAADSWHSISSTDAQFLRKALRMEQNPVRIRVGNSSGAAPLFLCADGSGIATTTCSLPADQTRDIWILHHERMWDPSAGSLDIVEHASMLADRIDSVYRDGGLIMGGWSFGGVLAWEVGYQLKNRSGSERVLGTVAIDSPCPLDHKPLDATIIASLMPQTRSTPNGIDDRSHSDKVDRLSGLTRQLIKASFLRSGAAMVGYAKRAKLDANTALGSVLESNKSTNGTATLDLCLLRSRESYWTCNLSESDFERHGWLLKRNCYGGEQQNYATLGWDHIGQLTMCCEIAGNHFTPFAKRNVASLSTELEKVCSFLAGP